MSREKALRGLLFCSMSLVLIPLRTTVQAKDLTLGEFWTSKWVSLGITFPTMGLKN